MPMAPVNKEQEALLISTDINEGNVARLPLAVNTHGSDFSVFQTHLYARHP